MSSSVVSKPSQIKARPFSKTHKYVLDLADNLLIKVNRSISDQFNDEPSSCVSINFERRSCLQLGGFMPQDFLQAINYVFLKLEEAEWNVKLIYSGDDVTFELRTDAQKLVEVNIGLNSIHNQNNKKGIF